MLAQDYSYEVGGSISPIFIVIWVAAIVLFIASYWKIFTKAGQPGWAAIIPIYNTIILLKIVGKPWWWLLLFFIPFVNIVLGIIVLVRFARSFGKGGGYAVGMLFLPFIFLPMLAFGSATYQGPPPD